MGFLISCILMWAILTVILGGIISVMGESGFGMVIGALIALAILGIFLLVGGIVLWVIVEIFEVSSYSWNKALWLGVAIVMVCSLLSGSTHVVYREK